MKLRSFIASQTSPATHAGHRDAKYLFIHSLLRAHLVSGCQIFVRLMIRFLAASIDPLRKPKRLRLTSVVHLNPFAIHR
jgi:hypothetical protein